MRKYSLHSECHSPGYVQIQGLTQSETQLKETSLVNRETARPRSQRKHAQAQARNTVASPLKIQSNCPE